MSLLQFLYTNTMIFSGYSVIVLVLVLINCSFSTRLKRADIDLQTCIDNFDVHRDKIIRTQDSQNMGAKYLNEIDLGAREECLRLCCETEDCDVFVFEEKNAGSCYLFHCGPPEDFRCKFTHHVNYSSAVLAINRHLPDLESQIKLTKHEQDLTKLRKPESEFEVIPQVEVRTTSPTTTSTLRTIEVLPEILVKTKTDEGNRKCSRYQFECRSTGECIAIYNACDGIPQCADGSDEAPELSCPDSLTTTVPVPPVLQNNPPLPPIRYDASNIGIPAPRVPQNLDQQNLYHPHPIPPVSPQVHRQPPPIAAQPLHIDPQDTNPNLRVNPIRYDTQYGMGQLQPPNWLPHQSNQMSPPQPPQPQIPHYIDKNSHIFNHKDTGYQVPDGQEISAMQYPPQDAINRDYSKMSNYFDNNYRQDNWPQNPEENQYNKYEVQPQIVQKEWPISDGVKYPPSPQTLPPQPSNTISIKHDQEKMVHELKHTPKNPTIPQVSSKATLTSQKIKIDHYPDVVAYKLLGETRDGAAETPGGAVLSLTLGLIITCIMALMIGCRLRLRRRMRKGGKSYAHDADYLVNGMYL